MFSLLLAFRTPFNNLSSWVTDITAGQNQYLPNFTTHSARNPGFIFDEHKLDSNHVILVFMNFAEFGPLPRIITASTVATSTVNQTLLLQLVVL